MYADKEREPDNLNTLNTEITDAAHLMFYDEHLWADDLKNGRPYSSRYGTFVRNVIRGSGIPRAHVGLSYLVWEELGDQEHASSKLVDKHWPRTVSGLKKYRPKVLVPLGRPALTALANKLGFTRTIKQNAITKLAGIPIYLEERNIYVFPVYHPEHIMQRKNFRIEFTTHMRYLAMAYVNWLRR